MVELGSGSVVFTIEKQFTVDDAVRIRRTVERVAPVREVVVDFSGAPSVEDAALMIVADLMKASPGCRFRLRGLTHHRRRLLRYMGVPDGAGEAPRSPTDGPASAA